MTESRLAFVSFQPNNDQFTAFLPLEELISSQTDLAEVLNKAALVYGHSVKKMRSLIAEIEGLRITHKLVPARKIWQLGDAIFELKDNLEKYSLQVDGLYDHLVRDLRVKRKWLEKVVIFRRYLPSQDIIPQSLNWGRCEKGTRRVAEGLLRGLYASGNQQR